MGQRYHINAKGDAGRCRALPGNCPFGDDAHHYTTAQEARMAYESDRDSFPRIIKAKFYRSGDLVKHPPSFDELKVHQEIFDKFKPEGAVGRGEGLFATTEVGDMARWVRGNSMAHAPHTPHEIYYNGPEPKVYSIDAYERAGWAVSDYAHQPDNPRAEDKARKGVEEYWATGIPLSEFLENRDMVLSDENYNYRNSGYEILFDPQYIEKSRVVSWDRIIKQAEDYSDREGFKRMKKGRRF